MILQNVLPANLNKPFNWLLLVTIFIQLMACSPENLPPGGEDPPPPPPPPPPGVAVLTTAAVTAITTNAATTGGNIASNGGANVTARGVCWGTTPAPTIAGNKTSDGTGNGAFTSNITGLNPGTVYYVRAYATNSAGTAYGDEKSFTTIAAPVTTTVTDIDGNVYETIQIGTQTWMKENLKVTKYNDGTTIPEVTVPALTPDSWLFITYGAWCYYENNAANNASLGKLYNWHAVNTGKLAPAGWRVPTLEDWNTLFDYLGGFIIAGGKMKTTNLWDTPNVGATNSSGFSGKPGGGRGGSNSTLGMFGGINYSGVFWTSTLKETGLAYLIALSSGSEMAGTHADPVRGGASVRCIKN